MKQGETPFISPANITASTAWCRDCIFALLAYIVCPELDESRAGASFAPGITVRGRTTKRWHIFTELRP
jgi:hypothetical protein